MHGAGGDTMRACVLGADGVMRVEKLRMPVPQCVLQYMPPHSHRHLSHAPLPSLCRAGEVLLKVKTCGVCHTDLHVMKSEVRRKSYIVFRGRWLRYCGCACYLPRGISICYRSNR